MLYGGFHGGVPMAGWFTTGNPIQMDDAGVPPFLGNMHTNPTNENS